MEGELATARVMRSRIRRKTNRIVNRERAFKNRVNKRRERNKAARKSRARNAKG
jgi:hypothetical protein